MPKALSLTTPTFLGMTRERLKFGEACWELHRSARKGRRPTQFSSAWVNPHLFVPGLRTQSYQVMMRTFIKHFGNVGFSDSPHHCMRPMPCEEQTQTCTRFVCSFVGITGDSCCSAHHSFLTHFALIQSCPFPSPASSSSFVPFLVPDDLNWECLKKPRDIPPQQMQMPCSR